MEITRDGLLADIHRAYDARIEAVRAHHDALRALALAKEALAADLASLRNEGRIEGKNEAEREASAREQLPSDYEEVYLATAALSRAQERLDATTLDLERWRDSLRVLEAFK